MQTTAGVPFSGARSHSGAGLAVHVLPGQVVCVLHIKDQPDVIVNALGPERLWSRAVRATEVHLPQPPGHPQEESLEMVGLWMRLRRGQLTGGRVPP